MQTMSEEVKAFGHSNERGAEKHLQIGIGGDAVAYVFRHEAVHDERHGSIAEQYSSERADHGIRLQM